MTVKGTGGTVSDAVARSVLVVPDGQAVPVATSGALGAGTITNTVNFPAAAVAGSQQLFLNVYPAYLSQVDWGDGCSVCGCRTAALSRPRRLPGPMFW